jgi:hypothetical protein
VYAFSHHQITTTENKLKGIIHVLADLAENSDYFGDTIYDGNDPLGTKVKDMILYALKSSEPISYQNAKKMLGEGHSFKEVLIAGLKQQRTPWEPATAEWERSDLEQYLHDLIPPTRRTKEEAARAATRREVRQDIRAGDPAAARAAAQAGGLSSRALRAAVRSERVGPLRSAFMSASWPEAVQAMDLASEEEKAVLRRPFIEKAQRALQQAGSVEDRAAIIKARTPRSASRSPPRKRADRH